MTEMYHSGIAAKRSLVGRVSNGLSSRRKPLASDAQAVADHANAGDSHGPRRDHGIEPAERRQRDRGDIVEKRPE